jgi:ATP/maltotriose-dependent transcriptional regulator MalT
VLAELANSEMDEGRIEDARRLAEEAIEVARGAGAATEEVRGLIALALTYSIGLRYGAASQILEEAARIVAEGTVTDEFVVATLMGRRGEIAILTGEFQRAIEMTETALARAARAGTTSQQRPFLRWRTITACVALGRWAEAERLVDAAEHDTTPMQYQWTIDLFLNVLIRQGRLAEAELAVQKTDRSYDTPWEGSWILQARIRLANGLARWADARAAADEAIGLFPAEGEGFLYDILPDVIRGEADWAEAARARRRTAEGADARRIGLERLARFRRIARGAIDRGGAGRLVEATLAMAEAEGSRLQGGSDPALWAEAARTSEALLQPWETAYARFREAEAILAARRERQAALRLLREARQAASELGARPLLDQIEGLARRGRLRLESGRRRRRTRQATNDEGVVVTITSREWEVLSLVAAGHTNREIGEALFISEKTASVHVTNAMDKLGALSRYDAAACAARLGLLDANEPAMPAPGGRRPQRTSRGSPPGPRHFEAFQNKN